jgi:integrase
LEVAANEQRARVEVDIAPAEVEEVEALARACEQGAYRKTAAITDEEAAARGAEDRQDAEAFRVLFYTGVRVGELLTLPRWPR